MYTNIQAVKISNYRIVYMLAAELELDTVVDLVQQILEQETEASQSLSHLFISRFKNIVKRLMFNYGLKNHRMKNIKSRAICHHSYSDLDGHCH